VRFSRKLWTRHRLPKPEATVFHVGTKGHVMIKTLSITSALFAATIALSALVGSAAPTQAAAQRCIVASQCKGPIFDLCMYCGSTGKLGCAHHVCVHHTCQVQICPEFKTYTPW
jgi:hypothetical protein